ncbi:hypothetical protein HHK36_024435 [Tetracentron sinense]|uniref:PCI domain-containing protein n=1 Tax=Tetracentron sinense TaxID=13715 RepID=A0A834YQN4_TETSI|nr:hypothetical protein HHK36_024435 [Tetracentron sinense]
MGAQAVVGMRQVAEGFGSGKSIDGLIQAGESSRGSDPVLQDSDAEGGGGGSFKGDLAKANSTGTQGFVAAPVMDFGFSPFLECSSKGFEEQPSLGSGPREQESVVSEKVNSSKEQSSPGEVVRSPLGQEDTGDSSIGCPDRGDLLRPEEVSEWVLSHMEGLSRFLGVSIEGHESEAKELFRKIEQNDLECIFTIICNLVTKSKSLDEALEMAKLIAAKVIQQPNEKPALRLKILFNLYSLLENPYSRFHVYMRALNLAVNGKVTERIMPSFKKMDSFLKEWNIGTLDQRVLFLTISNILKESKSSAKDSFNFLTKYLETFSVEDAYTMSETKEEAVRAAVEFVKAPDMFQRLDAYLDFHAANSTLLKSYGLVREDCITKMRLMSLVDLGSNDSGEIPYVLIKDTLRVTDEEVELWVVKAITAKLLDCKMDQMNQIVIVSCCTERVFGLHQWLALRLKLAKWRSNIANVINTIQANKHDSVIFLQAALPKSTTSFIYAKEYGLQGVKRGADRPIEMGVWNMSKDSVLTVTVQKLPPRGPKKLKIIEVKIT